MPKTCQKTPFSWLPLRSNFCSSTFCQWCYSCHLFIPFILFLCYWDGDANNPGTGSSNIIRYDQSKPSVFFTFAADDKDPYDSTQGVFIFYNTGMKETMIWRIAKIFTWSGPFYFRDGPVRIGGGPRAENSRFFFREFFFSRPTNCYKILVPPPTNRRLPPPGKKW